MRAHVRALLSIFVLGCGGTTVAPAAPAGEPSGDVAPAASGEAASPAPAASGAPDAPPVESSEAESATEPASLARDLVKRGGRKIGWSAQKKSFMVPRERRGSDGWSLDIVTTDDAGRQTAIERVCQPSECAEQFAELSKKAIPEITKKLEAGGYVALRAVGWPSGRDELEVSQLGMKLRYTGGRLEGVREGKPVARLGTVGRGEPKLLAIFVVPDSKLLAGFAAPDGDEGRTELFVVRLP